MKKYIAFFITLLIFVSILICALNESSRSKVDLIDVKAEEVIGIVTGFKKTPYTSGRYIYVQYKDATLVISNNETIYDKYYNNIGSEFPCIFITYTYSDESVKNDLVFNEEYYLRWEAKDNER